MTLFDVTVDRPVIGQCVYKDEQRASEVLQKFQDTPCQALIMKARTRSKNGVRFLKLSDLSSIYPQGKISEYLILFAHEHY